MILIITINVFVYVDVCAVLVYVYIVLLKECRKNLSVVAIFAIQVIEIFYLLGMGLGEFKLISFNVRGLSNFKKRTSILSWCRKQKVDIIFLQETHSSVQKEKQWKAEWGGPIELAHGSTNARGVGIFFRNGFDCKITKKMVDPLGSYIALEAKINDEKYFLVNIYAPNKDSDSAKFYDHLINVFKKDDRTFEGKIVVGGDFNCPLNPQMDKKGGIMITRQSIVDRIG